VFIRLLCGAVCLIKGVANARALSPSIWSRGTRTLKPFWYDPARHFLLAVLMGGQQELKLNTGVEQTRARDLFFGLWVPDLFMRRVRSASPAVPCPLVLCITGADVVGGGRRELESLLPQRGAGPRRCVGRRVRDAVRPLRDRTAAAQGDPGPRPVAKGARLPGALLFACSERALRGWLESIHDERACVAGWSRSWHPLRVWSRQIETGTPYITYKDACNRKSNQQNLGTIRSSNLCTEIIEYTSPDEVAVCNLASVALPMFVTDGTFWL